MIKNVVVLGSTGSVGTQALEIIKDIGYNLLAITANKNIKLIEKQAREFLPRYTVVTDKAAFDELKIKLADTAVQVLFGDEGMKFVCSLPQCDIVLNAVLGMVGLRYTLAALESGKAVALANKESLVAAGSLVKATAEKHGGTLLPVDSEHAAIHQCLQGRGANQIKRIILTASGGPFFGKTLAELEKVTLDDALKHPNWAMGAKITIDSATLMNKALELVEAVHLFDVTPEQVKIVVHRESILHSAVEFYDNSVIGQLGVPSMHLPIQYALTYPNRVKCIVPELDFAKIHKLTFYEPDLNTFGAVNIMLRALKNHPLSVTVVNAANEEAVAAFLAGKIKFLQIEELVAKAFEEIKFKKGTYNLNGVLEAEAQARQKVKEYIYSV